mgnify:CR=1 FL=1
MKLVDPWKMEENVEKVYKAYERIIPAVWALFADGEWWEEIEPYHEGCRDCAKRAFRTLSKTDHRMLEYLASGIVMWSNFFFPERRVVVFRIKWDNMWRTYTALVSHEGRRRIEERAHTEILLERVVDMSTNVDMTIRYLAQIVLDTVYELKEPEEAPAVRLNVRRAEPPKVVVDDLMEGLLSNDSDTEGSQ